MNITFISFASDAWKDSLQRIESQINNLGIFSSIILFDENILNTKTNFYKDNPKILEYVPHGHGGFLWKPYIIKKCFELFPETDVFFYSDSGNEFFFNTITTNRFNDYVNKAFKESFLAFQGPILEEKYGNCIVIDSIYPEARGTNQFNAGTLFIKNDKKAKEIINEWEWYSKKDNYLLLNNQKKCCESFYMSMHDQPILSCILKKYKILGEKDECDWFLSSPMSHISIENNKNQYPIFNARNPYKYLISDKCLKYHHAIKCIHSDNGVECTDMIVLR